MIFTIALGALIAFCIYVGPKEALNLKADLFGPGLIDATAVKIIDSDWQFGQFYYRYYRKPCRYWDMPMTIPGLGTIPVKVFLVFNKDDDLEAFMKIAKIYLDLNQSEVENYKILWSAKGAVAGWVETRDECPIVAFERSHGCFSRMKISWTDFDFPKKIRAHLKNLPCKLNNNPIHSI